MLQMQLLTLPQLILGGVGGNFHISLLFGMKLMWQKERHIVQQLDVGGTEGRELGQREEKRGERRMERVRVQEEEGGARKRGKAEEG